MMLRKIFLFVCLISFRHGVAQVNEVVQSDTFSIYFTVGNFSIGKAAQQTLDSAFFGLKGKEKITLYGYADQRGENENNLTLSAKRAEQIKLWFIRKGLADSMISAKGKGILPSDSNEIALKQSRRVDVVVNHFHPCSGVIVNRQFKPLYFRFNTGKLEDSSESEFLKLADFLKKNPCIKANIYTYNICMLCRNAENMKQSGKGTIETQDIGVERGKQLLQVFKSKGIDINSFAVRSVNIGCKSGVGKSVVPGITNKEESVLLQQLRADIKLFRK